MIEAQERLAKDQEKKVEVNVVILQSLLDLQKHGQLGTSHGEIQEEKTNGADGIRSQKGYRMDCDDTVKRGRPLGTPERRATTQILF